MQSMEMPFARMGDLTLTETRLGPHLITINDARTRTTTILAPDSRKYFQQQAQESQLSPYGENTVMERKKVGDEDVQGHPCVKYEATYFSADDPERKFQATLWEAKDLQNLAIRIEMTKPMPAVTEFKDVKIGNATADMFAIPEEYQAVNSMAELMGLPDVSSMEKEAEQGMKKVKGLLKKLKGDDD